MHLIQVLAAGVRGAELGTAELFKRGTSTRAQWYTEFEAGTGTTIAAGSDIDLDSNGGAIVYVNELVQVVVKDASGSPIRTFVAGDNASAVEVMSDSFTGVDYVTALSGVNEPTTLEAILNDWNDSAGAPDWNVLVGGSTLTIQNALANTALFVNVKAPQFGAVGDGVADDTAAINAAALYAESTGIGTIFFPPGTYLISATIDLPAGVHMLGSGAGGSGSDLNSVIQRSTSSFISVTLDGGTSGEYHIQRLVFADANTGTNQVMISVPDGSTLNLAFCETTPPTTAAVNGAPVFNNACGNLNLRYCRFTLRGAQGRIVGRTGAGLNNETIMVACTVTFAGTIAYATTFGINGICRLVGNTIHTSFTAGLLPPTQLVLPYTPSTITGNKWTSAISDTIVALSADGAAGAGTENGIVEAGNLYASNFFVTGQNDGNMLSQSQYLRRNAVFTIAAPGTISLTATGGTVVVTTTGAAGTYTLAFPTTGVPRWSDIELIVRNTSGNNHTLDFTGTSPADTGVALNAATRSLRALYKYRTDGTTTSWFRMTGFTVTAP